MFRWLALFAVALESVEAFNFWAVLTWLPIRSEHGWWRAVALTDALNLTGRVALLVVGIVAMVLLRAYARRLDAILRNRTPA
jgi:hypothetical protein